MDERLCPDRSNSKRHAAVTEVLLRLPPDAYDRLVGMAGSFAWDLPEADRQARFAWDLPTADGQAGRFRCPGGHVGVILLGQQLERKSSKHVIVTVAHELAHVVLGHPGLPEAASGVLDPATDDAYLVERERREGEAWDLAEKWGFDEVRFDKDRQIHLATRHAEKK